MRSTGESFKTETTTEGVQNTIINGAAVKPASTLGGGGGREEPIHPLQYLLSSAQDAFVNLLLVLAQTEIYCLAEKKPAVGPAERTGKREA